MLLDPWRIAFWIGLGWRQNRGLPPPLFLQAIFGYQRSRQARKRCMPSLVVYQEGTRIHTHRFRRTEVRRVFSCEWRYLHGCDRSPALRLTAAKPAKSPWSFDGLGPVLHWVMDLHAIPLEIPSDGNVIVGQIDRKST